MPHKVSRAPGLGSRYIHSQDVIIYHNLEKARQNYGELSPTFLLRLHGRFLSCYHVWFFFFFFFPSVIFIFTIKFLNALIQLIPQV